ncbi:hypothetical protein [Botryobacter ruber]|uniref:hypothetical protein n=1 Tax=Botryobacter ruber TaxID=2171629 RepID=UPI000E0A021D|nr:hypothetical protein [Botryobacter ruber]
MIEFLRSLFGLSDVTGNRTVVGGGPVSVDARQVQYIKDSNLRIAALHQLYTRYKGTPHEAKLKEVYTKTKDIHVHLVHKKRVHELELFHLQNTDHFLNTFTIILDVHQKHTAPATTATAPEPESFFKNLKSATATLAGKTKPVTEPARQPAIQRHQEPARTAVADAPAATLPEVSIDTSSRIRYNSEDEKGIPTTKAIGFTSSQEEKEAFLAHVASRVGMYRRDVTYVGNAMLTLPAAYSGPPSAAYAPILHWRGLTYALSLSDYRLYPVKIYRRSF